MGPEKVFSPHFYEWSYFYVNWDIFSVFYGAGEVYLDSKEQETFAICGSVGMSSLTWEHFVAQQHLRTKFIKKIFYKKTLCIIKDRKQGHFRESCCSQE